MVHGHGWKLMDYLMVGPSSGCAWGEEVSAWVELIFPLHILQVLWPCSLLGTKAGSQKLFLFWVFFSKQSQQGQGKECPSAPFNTFKMKGLWWFLNFLQS